MANSAPPSWWNNTAITPHTLGQTLANRSGHGDNRYVQGANAAGDPAGMSATRGLDFSQKGVKKQGGFEGIRKKAHKETGLDDSNIAERFDATNLFKDVHNPNESGFRQDQGQLVQMLMARAQGQGPTLADSIAAQQRTQGMNNISAQTASNRGVNPALAARGAQMAAANLSGQLNQQRTTGNLQEQQMAQQSLGGMLQGARDQDNQFQQMLVNRSMMPAQATLQENLQAQNLNAQGKMKSRDTRFQNWKIQQDLGGDMLKGMGTAMSDERVKNSIEEISKEDVSEFLSAIKPKSYKYNDESHGEGDRVGFVLQDVASTKLGKKMTAFLCMTGTT